MSYQVILRLVLVGLVIAWRLQRHRRDTLRDRPSAGLWITSLIACLFASLVFEYVSTFAPRPYIWHSVQMAFLIAMFGSWAAYYAVAFDTAPVRVIARAIAGIGCAVAIVLVVLGVLTPEGVELHTRYVGETFAFYTIMVCFAGLATLGIGIEAVYASRVSQLRTAKIGHGLLGAGSIILGTSSLALPVRYITEFTSGDTTADVDGPTSVVFILACLLVLAGLLAFPIAHRIAVWRTNVRAQARSRTMRELRADLRAVRPIEMSPSGAVTPWLTRGRESLIRTQVEIRDSINLMSPLLADKLMAGGDPDSPDDVARALAEVVREVQTSDSTARSQQFRRRAATTLLLPHEGQSDIDCVEELARRYRSHRRSER